MPKKRFYNQIPTPMDMSVSATLGVLIEMMKGSPNRRPAGGIAVEPFVSVPPENDAQTRVTWFGHSALFIEIEGKSLLLDPMFGRAPSPVPMFGSKRYGAIPPVEIERLPPVNAVILSHDHYDHLDRGSIKKLRNKTERFIVPHGVGERLRVWGVDPEKIQEYGWWDELELEGLKLACTPARHFSGRSLFDRDSTLWCSWVIAGRHTKVYFSGDSGYGPHFREIGDKYGPFDLTLMECGQYDERWSSIHMMPEETVQAHLDVRGKVMIPIHWAAFTLALHDWTDPAERVTKAAMERGVTVSTPKIGETVVIGSSEYPAAAWWK